MLTRPAPPVRAAPSHAALCGLLFLAAAALAPAQQVDIAPNGPEQMPIIYVHGFNDDGRLFPDDAGEYWKSLGADTHPALPDGQEQDYFVVQWASLTMDPYSPASEGWAVLQTENRMRNGPNYNSTDPVAYLFSNIGDLRTVIDCPDFNPLDPSTWFSCESPAANFLRELHDRRIRNNYNRNGYVAAHAPNLRDRLNAEFATGGQLAHTWQVNVLTHSAGGLDTRATLHLMNESPSRLARERIANVVYTAPPFAGSTLAELGRQAYASSPMSPTIFVNPWFVASFVDQDVAIETLIRAWLMNGQTTTAAQDLMLEVMAKSINVTVVGGLAIRGSQIAADPGKAAAAALVIEGIKKLVTDFVGFPGDPKMSEDLTPLGGINHLNSYGENPHTRQFVLWGEQDNLAMLNLAPPLPIASSNYASWVDFGVLEKTPGDFAVANVSSYVLSDFDGNGGYMRAIGAFPENHGGIVTNTRPHWARRFLAPITSMRLQGGVTALDEDARLYLISPTTQFSFTYDVRNYTGSDGINIQPNPAAVQYRVVIYPPSGSAIFSDWTDELPSTTSGTFADLAAMAGTNLPSGVLFRVDWRSINQWDGRELFRFAFFRIDGLPPTVTKTEFFDIEDPSGSEIVARQSVTVGVPPVRSSVFEGAPGQFPNLEPMLTLAETDYVLRDPVAKFVRIEFTEGGTIDYVWNDPTFAAPASQALVNRAFAQYLGDVITPGVNVLYYRSRDAVGNTTGVQQFSVLVDNQPPVAALNFTPALPLEFIVGPTSPLYFEAYDVELGSATGSLTVPGLPGGSIPVNTAFTLGDTTIAQNAPPGLTATLVTLTANVADAVGNQRTQTFELLYDWTGPELSVQFVGDVGGTTRAQELASGNFRTADATVRVEIAARDNGTGINGPEYRVGQPGTDYQAGGGPFVLEQVGGRPLAWAGEVPLFNGLNLLTISTTDFVGNPGELTFAIERVDQLITFDAARPIEILSRRDPGAAEDVPSTGSILKVAVNDDGSVYVFESERVDLLPFEVSRVTDVYAWNNGSILLASSAADGTPGNDRSFTAAVSGDGRYVYFASEATNLVDESALLADHVNLYVKDLTTGQIALINRDQDGHPANLPSAFVGTTSYLQMSATTSGRYLFFNDRFDGYLAGDTNGNHDIYCLDLDPDVNGSLFDDNYVIRRVSLGADGTEGTGGLLSTGGSRYPVVSADGTRFVYESDHVGLFPGSGAIRSAILCVLAGADADGTIDFSSRTNVVLNRYTEGPNEGDLSPHDARHPHLDRSGLRAYFVTASNLVSSDQNNPAVDTDVYESFETFGAPTSRLNILASGSAAGRIANNHTPVNSLRPLGSSVRSFVADKVGLTTPGRSGDPVNDLFVWTVEGAGFQRINWVLPELQTTHPVIDGGVTSDSRWAWWVTLEKYDETIGAGTGYNLYRRRIDQDAGGADVDLPGGGLPNGPPRAGRGDSFELTTEAGGSRTFEIVLGSRPNFEVRAGITSSDPTEGVPDVDVIVFTTSNWNVPQSFTITGQPDDIHDGDREYLVRVMLRSKDSLFENVLAREIAFRNVDDDPPPTVGFVAAAQVVEEVAGRVVLDLHLTGSETDLPVSVAFATANGTAAAGLDYEAATGTVLLSPGLRTQRLAIDLIPNDAFDEDRTFSVQLSSPENATLGTATLTVTIRDTPGQVMWAVR